MNRLELIRNDSERIVRGANESASLPLAIQVLNGFEELEVRVPVR